MHALSLPYFIKHPYMRVCACARVSRPLMEDISCSFSFASSAKSPSSTGTRNDAGAQPSMPLASTIHQPVREREGLSGRGKDVLRWTTAGCIAGDSASGSQMYIMCVKLRPLEVLYWLTGRLKFMLTAAIKIIYKCICCPLAIGYNIII